MSSRWRRRSSRHLFESPWFSVRQDELTLPGGEEITYTVVEHPGYAMVVPVLDDGRVVMERVYRHSVGNALLECPSGGLDGEPPAVAARRELEEETGYVASHLEPLGRYFASSGISNEQFHLFVRTGLSEGGTIHREITEEIDVELIALSELVRRVHRGELTDGPSALGLLLAHARLRGRS